MSTFFQEIRHACRMLVRSPGFTAIAALSLGLGIGANTAMFSVADTLLLRPLPVRDPGAIVSVGVSGLDGRIAGVSYPNYRDLRDQSHSFDGLIAYQRQAPRTFARAPRDVREMRMGMLVSDNFFDVLGVQPALGRTFTAQDGRGRGSEAVVVLGYHFWKNVLGSDASIVGTVVWINGVDFTVVGVAPERFTGLDESIVAFWAPILMAERLDPARDGLLEDRAAHAFAVKGRLASGVSLSAARAEVSTLWSRLEQQFPGANRQRTIAVRTQLEDRIQDEGTTTAAVIAMMVALVALVLLIACANVASLMLGRGRARSREMAIRLALGVSCVRLLRQLLIESGLLALIGCALGLALAYAGLGLLQATQSQGDVRVDIAPQLHQRALVFSLMAAGASALLCGLAPAWQSLRTQLVSSLKTGDVVQTPQRTGGRNALVVAQVALSMVLLVAAGVLLEGFRKTLVVDPGFRIDRLMRMSLDTSAVRYTPADTRRFYRALQERARALPGVASAAVTSFVLLERGGSVITVEPEGYQLPPGQEAVSMFHAVVDEHYFDTIGTAIVRGRAFTADDNEGAPDVAIINDQLAKRYWPNQDPIGQRMRLTGGERDWVEVVGVTATGKYLFVAEAPTPFFYLPVAQHEKTSMSLLVATTGADPGALAGPLRDVVRDLDVNQPVFNVQTLSNLYEQRAVRTSLRILGMVGTMGFLGLTLALVGLYGLVSYTVARRTREIGLRMALGAQKADVVKMVLRHGAGLSAAGILVGGIASVGVARALAAGMAGLGAPNPTIYVIIPIMVVVLTLAASYVPAHRASRVDPLRALPVRIGRPAEDAGHTPRRCDGTCDMERAVIADAPEDQVEHVEGNVYFPRSAVNMDLLKESDTHTVCAWKGTASYYDVVVDGETNKDAAWHYPDPKPEAKAVDGRIAFWKGVTVFR